MNAVEQVRKMYAAINQRDVKSAVACIDPNCTYQDLNFSKPFEGRAAIAQMFEDTLSQVPDDFKFVIDDIAGDNLAAGLTWHVELGGTPFPNTRGASFYRLSPASGLIVFGRDVVESPIKPGKAAFAIIKLVTPLARWWLKPQSQKEKTQKRKPTTEKRQDA